MPKRIHRKTRYTKLPEGAVLVTRGSRWGNPFRLVEHGGEYTREESIRLYREYIIKKIREEPERYDLSLLRGKDLACSCKLEELCHGDVLLELANGPAFA
ncbi:MAG: DUF4326 domain-containing protein [Phaeodactylibacter sp.]|nr:DUF4326 domain-containing protein [Phaeodactylibacter sp.]MCB0612379.1 DUF4326 domain-containing protein [Phaeodactylibacter sp.]